MGRTLVTVVAPVYNEEALVHEFVQRLGATADGLAESYDFEFVLADDGSVDGTLEILTGLIEAEPRLRVVELRRNYGQTQALQAGLDHARGEIIVTMDADLQTFPEELPAFLTKLEEGPDIVCGWRTKRVEGVRRRWPSRAANALLRAASGVALHDFGNTFRAFRREFSMEMRLWGEAHRYLPILGHHLGARITEIPVSQVERRSGRSSYGLSRTLGVMTDLVMLHLMRRYLDRPMRAFGKLGWLLFGLGFLLLAAAAIYGLAAKTSGLAGLQGWLVLGAMLIVMAAMSFLFGFVAEILVRLGGKANDSRVYRVRRVWAAEPDRAEPGEG
ncbi:MAG: glycosyltransferase family 2 protein [Proteobacteria bacterium]|nr:glycosyltransferase family 2 protein [Pseudomonadota bacterium]MBU1741075.1 glycosyltransferase family 2 protein [Pseudomonadota bacterium]